MQSEALVPGTADEEEMIRLINLYGNMLLGMCTLIVNDNFLAQDIVQETFVRAWKNRRLSIANEKSWLIKVASNLCRDYYRSRWWKQIEHRISVDDLQIPIAQTESSGILEMVHQLPYKEKEVIIHFYWNKLSVDEIVDSLGINRATVYRRLEKAKRHRKLELEGGWQNE